LLALKAELENLIQLTKDYLKSQGGAASSSSSSHHQRSGEASTSSRGASTSAATSASHQQQHANFTTGTDILAKWHKDGKFYTARVASVSGSTDDPVYTVIFDVDKSTEVVRKHDVKPLTESKKRALEYSNKRQHSATTDDSESADAAGGSSTGGGMSKRAKQAEEKTEKKLQKESDRKQRVAEQNNKQSSWQSFAKKSTKKGVNIPGVKGESLFKTPDNPYGRGAFLFHMIDATAS
jgi:survival-of-motor-neuron-related-splicing factor 30